MENWQLIMEFLIKIITKLSSVLYPSLTVKSIIHTMFNQIDESSKIWIKQSKQKKKTLSYETQRKPPDNKITWQI